MVILYYNAFDCYSGQSVGLIILTDLKLRSRSIFFLSIKAGNGIREQLFIYIQQFNNINILILCSRHFAM